MNNSKIWLFRILVLAGAAIMLASWFLPWWTIDINDLGYDMVQIRPWGLVVDQRMGSFEVLIKGANMPEWFAPLMWAYLALCLIALLVSLFVRGSTFGVGTFKLHLSQILVGGVGVSYIIAGIVAVVYASMRLASFYNTPLQGTVYVELGDAMHTSAESRLLPGYYLIYAAGFLLLVTALLRDKLTGESKTRISGQPGAPALHHSRV